MRLSMPRRQHKVKVLAAVRQLPGPLALQLHLHLAASKNSRSVLSAAYCSFQNIAQLLGLFIAPRQVWKSRHA